MGCWNKTCGLSNLHIRHGEDVYVFVLRQNSSEGRCYNISFYSPTLVPFECQYDDYGGGENAHGIALDPLMDAVRNNLIERSVDENSRQQKLTREEFDVDTFFESVHDGNLTTYDAFNTKEVLLDFVMMRKDIVRDVLDNYSHEVWMRDKQQYEIYYYANVIADIPFFMQDVFNYIDTRREDPILLDYTIKTLDNFSDISSNGISIPGVNLVAININKQFEFTRIFNPNTYLVQLISNRNFKEASLFIAEYMKGVFINHLIASTRRQWIPGCHEGSQANDVKGYIVLNNAISKFIDAEIRECDDDE